MTDLNTRWQQRLSNYREAFNKLNAAVDVAQTRNLSDLERLGLIKVFEYTHELAWNVMKDYFAYQGYTAITGARDAVRVAFNKGLVKDGEGWMEMIHIRNQTVDAYSEKVAAEIAECVVLRCRELLRQFLDRMSALESNA